MEELQKGQALPSLGEGLDGCSSLPKYPYLRLSLWKAAAERALLRCGHRAAQSWGIDAQ